MAILTKDRAGSLRYVIPDGPVPTSISWTLYDPSGTELATAQPIAPPTSYASASAVAGTRMDEVEITLAADPAGIAVGEIVRVFDVWGRTFDCVCYGKVSATKKVRLSDCAVAIDEVANIHNPVVSIPLASSYLDDTGDGWRVDLEITQDGTTRNHALWFAVALLTVTLAISPREYLNQNPNATRDAKQKQQAQKCNDRSFHRFLRRESLFPGRSFLPKSDPPSVRTGTHPNAYIENMATIWPKT